VQSLWEDAFKYAYSEKKEVFSFAVSLKNKRYKVGFLSNTEEPTMNFFYKQGYTMFDEVIFSCEKGFLKPQREIYEIILQRLCVQPEEALFIDDKRENILAAEKVGIQTILFKNPEQLKKELKSLSVIID